MLPAAWVPSLVVAQAEVENLTRPLLGSRARTSWLDVAMVRPRAMGGGKPWSLLDDRSMICGMFRVLPLPANLRASCP